MSYFVPLEVFGWLFLGDVYDPATKAKEPISNHGLKDQQMAFRWAKDNIAEVGGDPNKVSKKIKIKKILVNQR